MSTYDEVKKDHSYLWSIGPASDMTGGYVDSEDLDRLLANPTKTTAKNCMINQIEYWFSVGIEDIRHKRYESTFPSSLEKEHPEIREIADKYGIDF